MTIAQRAQRIEVPGSPSKEVLGGWKVRFLVRGSERRRKSIHIDSGIDRVYDPCGGGTETVSDF